MPVTTAVFVYRSVAVAVPTNVHRVLSLGNSVLTGQVTAPTVGSVTLTEVNGPAVTFEFKARDALEEVARGKHSRFVVGVEKTAQRLQAKRAKAG